VAKRILPANADSKIADGNGQTIVTQPANSERLWRRLIRENGLMQSEYVRINCHMLRGNFTLFLALLLMNGNLFSAESEAGRGTGIEGVVTVSPVRPGPTKKGSEVSNAPLPNAIFTVANEKGTVTSFTTDGEGRFRISLKPGHYAVSLSENRFPRPCGPFEVDVESGKMTTVEWRCDSGMR
jgi:hypothetical protein